MKKILILAIVACTIWACEEIVAVPDISGETVNPLAPTDQAVFNTSQITFSWDEVIDAEEYHIQIATPTFEAAQQIITDSTLSETQFVKQLEPNDYQWRIKAVNSAYETSYVVQSFSIASGTEVVSDISNETVALLAPTDGVELDITQLNFSWEAVEGAEQYHLQIATPSFAAAQQIVEDITVSSTQLSTTLEPGTYEWRVKATNSEYETQYTSAAFTITEE